ncbi:MAG: DNA repair protein RadC [Bacillota bacterium]|nr:DNA repair protein RadC [Bacillota bacterium]
MGTGPLREWPRETRPRERILAQGSQSLSPQELLAILLGTGKGPGQSALDLAVEILRWVESRYGQGVASLARASGEELCKIPGVGPAKASRVMAALELGRRVMAGRLPGLPIQSPADVAAWLQPQLGHLAQEQVVVLWLDAKHRVLGHETVSVGSLQEALAYPRDIFRGALIRHAAAVIVAHNHPSGDPTPSPEDWSMTQRMREAGRVVGVEMLDHIIVAAESFVSLRQLGWDKGDGAKKKRR